MIERYTLPEMGALWSEQNKFQKWLDVEIAVCEVHAENGTIPQDALAQIKSRARFSVERINEIEQTTDHVVIAFTTNLAESIGEASRFVHYGLTSSDGRYRKRIAARRVRPLTKKDRCVDGRA
jgi:adenylosuccinate lyase